jgi:glycosyltransferase involved in cell wall biosynthesis
MRICLYSPYIPKHTGGGEKYLFDVAMVLAEKHEVFIAIPQLDVEQENAIRLRYERFLQKSLKTISFIPSPLGTGASFTSKWLWTKQFDVLYYATDGSLFFSGAKKNILHIQLPLQLNKTSLMEKLKLANWQIKNTNSEFTKQVVEKSWQTHIDVVHHPKIDVDEIKAAAQHIKKEKVIVSVGRFFRQLHSKRQDVMVNIFHQLLEKLPTQTKGWKLVLIGGVEDQEYLAEVKRLAGKAPIEIYTDLDREQLVEWYGKASIYWHAAGYGIDEKTHPEKLEHFGISTVEAMAAGCAPLVYGKGGQVEIMGAELHDQLWLSDEECIQKTQQFIVNGEKRQAIGVAAQERAQIFGPETFAQKLWQMVEGTS